MSHLPVLIPNTVPQLSYLTALPNDPPIARLIILHGYGDHAGRHAHVLQWMSDRGIAGFAPDFRGHGHSAGKPGVIHRWEDYLSDLAAFLALPQIAEPNPPLFILGHSHGGLITAAAGIKGLLDRCRGVILVAPYLKLKLPVPIHKMLIAQAASRLLPSLAIKSGLTGAMLTRDQDMIAQGKTDPFVRGIATPRWFTETRKKQKQVRAAAEQFTLPLLLLLPGQDTVADPDVSNDFFDRVGSTDKTIVNYPEHRHELLREIGREQIFATVLDWMTARL